MRPNCSISRSEDLTEKGIWNTFIQSLAMTASDWIRQRRPRDVSNLLYATIWKLLNDTQVQRVSLDNDALDETAVCFCRSAIRVRMNDCRSSTWTVVPHCLEYMMFDATTALLSFPFTSSHNLNRVTRVCTNERIPCSKIRIDPVSVSVDWNHRTNVKTVYFPTF